MICIIIGCLLIVIFILTILSTNKRKRFITLEAKIINKTPATILKQNVLANEIEFEYKFKRITKLFYEDNEIGETIKISYDPIKDTVYSYQDNTKPQKNKYNLFIIGILLIIVGIAMDLLQKIYDFPILPISCGICFLILGIYVSSKIKNSLNNENCSIIEGTIVTLKERTDHDTEASHMMYTPVYKYIYEGKELFLEGNISTSNYKKYKPGSTVNIIYDHNTDSFSCKEDLKDTMSMSRLFIFIGILLIIVSAILFIRQFL